DACSTGAEGDDVKKCRAAGRPKLAAKIPFFSHSGGGEGAYTERNERAFPPRDGEAFAFAPAHPFPGRNGHYERIACAECRITLGATAATFPTCRGRREAARGASPYPQRRPTCVPNA